MRAMIQILFCFFALACLTPVDIGGNGGGLVQVVLLPDASLPGPDAGPDVCQPQCATRRCGPDGCGGVCGDCASDETCSPLGVCLRPGENTDPACSDGLDNDLDGFTDCGDWNCCKDGLPAPGITVCAPGTCRAIQEIAECEEDHDCPGLEVCEECPGQRVCAPGCHRDDQCGAGERCLQPGCFDCPCPGRCVPLTLVIVTIEPGTHHLGDGPAAEGTQFQCPFQVPLAFTHAWLELDFPGGPGPNLEQPPRLFLDGRETSSVAAFYPPLDPTAPGWQTNPDGSHGYNRAMHVSLEVTDLVAAGQNSFLIVDGRPDDDFLFTNVQLWLW